MKIEKKRLFPGKNGAQYLDVIMMENKNGTDQYGSDGMICQSVSQDERKAGVKGPILGNFKIISGRPQTADQAEEKQQRERPQQDTRSDGGEPLPF